MCAFSVIIIYFKSPSLHCCIDKVLMVEVLGGTYSDINR